LSIKKYKIGIFGLWHLGCVLSAAWSKLGHNVIGFDYDKKLINNISQVKVPIFEPGLNDLIEDRLENKNLFFSNDLEDLSNCDFIFLSYDTPVNDDDSIDLTILQNSVKDLVKVMKNNSILIISSQVPVGYCSDLRKKLKNKNKTLDLAYSPENLRLGDAISCYLNPERIILGTSNKLTEEACSKLFLSITDKIQKMSFPSSEMVKHGINSFLGMSIVFANSLADICENTGARIEDVVKGIKSDSRIGQKSYLSPGIGFSGGTLGRDLKVLDQISIKTSNDFRWFNTIHEFNINRKNIIVNKINNILNSLDDKVIGVLGLTYKPNTSTLRRSLPLEIVNLLSESGAIINVFDPRADYEEINIKNIFSIKKSIEEVSLNANMLLLLTEWSQFKTFDYSLIKKNMKSPIIFDTKNFLNETNIYDYGLEYYSIGSKS
jgi:UDPglucose 6-dehydrogenase